MDESYVNMKIKQICREKGWTDYRLAKECGMPNSTIHNILYKTAVPSFGSLMKICDGFGITMAQFFAENDAVYLTDDQKELLELYGNLSLHEREIAAAYLKGFASRK